MIKGIIVLGLLFSTLVAQAQRISTEAFELKEKINYQQYQLKLQLEAELNSAAKQKRPLDKEFISRLHRESPNMACIEWVYRGSASREEAVRACRGVKLLDCVEWVYRGPGSREEAAQACRYVTDMDCVEWVYRGSATRMESARACADLPEQCIE